VARQSWIAERLVMRSANVSQQVRRHRIRNPEITRGTEGLYTISQDMLTDPYLLL
jgi:hypothetical protein